jgi:hypothetical protein
MKNKSSDAALSYTRQNCEEGDIVYYMDTEEVIKRGWVRVNDPFLEQMELWVHATDDDNFPDKNVAPIFVLYKNFRNKPQEESEDILGTCEEDEVFSPPPPPSKKPSQNKTRYIPTIDDALADIVAGCERGK